MTKILLLSDTHSYIDERILSYAKESDEIWHAGDIGDIQVADKLSAIKPFKAVYGNIDNDQVRMTYPLNNIFYCEDVKVLITHIGGYPNKYTARVRALLENEKPDLYLCGHSHILKVINDKKLGILHMNPGAAGIVGFHQVRTMLRFTIDKIKIENLEVIELGKRG